jgi:sialate O-acetylesterase
MINRIINIVLTSMILLVSLFLLTGCFEYRSPSPPPHSDADEILGLSGQWKFTIGDDIKWSKVDYDDSEWEMIEVPSSWENQGFHGYDGFAWYRKTFTFPQNESEENIYLHLGYIDDIDEVYFNGQLIGISGGFPPYSQTAYNAYRRYFVPAKLISKTGDNIIAVRVYDSELEGGIISGSIGLYRAKEVSSPDINLSGEWKFKTGDDPLWSDKLFDDSRWNNIFVPAHWETQGHRDYDGFAWYRRSFTIPEEYADEKLILLLGQIDDIDQAFINGKFVGSTGIWYEDETPTEFNQNNEYLELRTYFIPEGLLNKTGENVIAVRVYDGFRDGGIYEGPVGLITQKHYREFWQKNRN